MFISVTELKDNLNKYLTLAATEDIYITRNGKTIAKLTSPYQDKLKILDELAGSIPDTITLEEAREERLSKI
ncbi:MAG: type II toxin-antitoxin system Phd/YefM family antitoxin [Oscillospiraceae bacterium]|nr:type II toxin-antitoxin system Phd/YefM family antitoxin [Oscillospiraceae bacterium]